MYKKLLTIFILGIFINSMVIPQKVYASGNVYISPFDYVTPKKSGSMPAEVFKIDFEDSTRKHFVEYLSNIMGKSSFFVMSLNLKKPIEAEIISSDENILSIYDYKDYENDVFLKRGIVKGNGKVDIIYKYKLDGKDRSKVGKIEIVNFKEQTPIVYNGIQIFPEVKPVIIDDRAMISVRTVEEFGYNVEWNNQTREVNIISKDNIVFINYKIDSNKVAKNGEEIYLDTPGQVVEERIMIPLRSFSEMIGMDVQWDDNLKTILINHVLDN